jgi:hypothetical protein
MTEHEVKKLITDNLDFLSAMSVQEYTLYRKWYELHHAKWSDKDLRKIQQVKKNIWIPKSPEDYKNLNVKVIVADSPEKLLTWRILRMFTSTAVWSSSPGRSIRCYVVHEEMGKDPFGFGLDQPTYKYLGTISLGSDFLTIGGRDAVIKWTDKEKIDAGMLKHTAMGSSIVPTQPLGYNYLGGKLVSLLVLSDTIEQIWNDKYAEKLVGVTTTSLYGGYSQYNSLKYWKKCKSSAGKVLLEPSDEVYKVLKQYCEETMPERYEFLSNASHPRYKIIQQVYNTLKIKAPKSEAPRGVYWAPLYNNTNEFLRCEVDEPDEKKFDNSVETLVQLWKDKYAEKRITKLTENNSTNDDVLFYDDMKDISWEEAKTKYLDNVGR